MIRAAATALILSTLAALGLISVYIAGGQPQVEGALLFVALGGIGVAMGLWGRELAAGHVDIEERPTLPSARRTREDFVESLERGEQAIGRRMVLVRLFGIAAAGLGIAALFPIRSLGPKPGNALRQTNWRVGSRAIVDATGQPIRPADLELGSIVTVFPDGNQSQEDSATVLIRVDPNRLQLKPGVRSGWWTASSATRRSAHTSVALSGCTARPPTTCCARVTRARSTCCAARSRSSGRRRARCRSSR
jgi:ubiquinol-cytochrome c reductase iron-sulfur subunit